MYKLTCGLIMVTSTVFAQAPTNGLLAHYPFNGNANDESGNGRDGIVTGTTLTADRFGNANNAYYFDGLGSNIELSNTSSLNMFTGFTLASWVNFTEDGGAFISKHENYYKNSFNLGGGQGKLYLHTDVDLYYVSSTKIINDGEWHFVVGTFDGVQLSIYIDGIAEGSSTANYSTGNSINIRLGRDSDLWFYKGLLDDVRLYNRAITSDEVFALYNEGKTATEISNINTLKKDLFNAYPNPATDYLIIEGNKVGASSGNSLLVKDLMGQTVFRSTINQNQLCINLDNWTKQALYFVLLLDSQNTVVEARKIIVQ